MPVIDFAGIFVLYLYQILKMKTKQELSQANPLQRKAYKVINSLIDRRSGVEHRWLYEQYIWQKREWEKELEGYTRINYFDDQKQQKMEHGKYLAYLIQYGDERFKELGFLK